MRQAIRTGKSLFDSVLHYGGVVDMGVCMVSIKVPLKHLSNHLYSKYYLSIPHINFNPGLEKKGK